MSKKDEFVKAFQEKTGKHPKEFHDSKDHKGFTKITDKNPDLVALFRAAVEDTKGDAAAGLNLLFP